MRTLSGGLQQISINFGLFRVSKSMHATAASIFYEKNTFGLHEFSFGRDPRYFVHPRYSVYVRHIALWPFPWLREALPPSKAQYLQLENWQWHWSQIPQLFPTVKTLSLDMMGHSVNRVCDFLATQADDDVAIDVVAEKLGLDERCAIIPGALSITCELNRP